MKKITIVPLGDSDINGLSVGAYKYIFEGGIASKHVICRTDRHSVAEYMKSNGISFETLDRFYEASETFDDMYIRVMEYFESILANGESIVFCVPGIPANGDILVGKMLETFGEDIEILGGTDVVSRITSKAGIVSDKGISLIPAHLLNKSLINTRVMNIITEVDNKFLASEIKLMLLDKYPDDTEILYIYGHPDAKIVKTSLFDLDRQKIFDFSVNFVIYPLDNFEKKFYDIEALFEVMRILRGRPPESYNGTLKYSENGCSWDKEQTHRSIRVNMIEEAYEVVQAINNDDTDNLIEELGDMLLQIVFHAEIASETGEFDFKDIVNGISEKLLRRHPHVFGDITANNADEALKSWEEMKKQEKKDKAVSASIAGLPKDLPSLTKACKIQKKTGSVGFDFAYSEEAKQILSDITEKATKENIGELLFATADAARQLGYDPDIELIEFTDRFVDRFNKENA